MRRQRPQRRLLRANKRGTTLRVPIHVIARCLRHDTRQYSCALPCHCEGAERPWQSQGCEIETCKSKTEVISKLLEFNGITTSCALHTPRNDRETSSRIYFGILPFEIRNAGKILKQVQDDKNIPSPCGRGLGRGGNNKIPEQVRDDD